MTILEKYTGKIIQINNSEYCKVLKVNAHFAEMQFFGEDKPRIINLSQISTFKKATTPHLNEGGFLELITASGIISAVVLFFGWFFFYAFACIPYSIQTCYPFSYLLVITMFTFAIAFIACSTVQAADNFEKFKDHQKLLKFIGGQT